MSVNHEVSEDGKVVTIYVEDRFDFSLHQTFRDAYCDSEVNNATFIIDLKSTTYMDSSALGMILLLKDFTTSNSSKILIKNANESVYKVLHIAQFNRLMEIEQ